MRLRFSILLIVLAAILTACGPSVKPIGEILGHPRDYVGQKVRVQGTVMDIFTLRQSRMFVLSDHSGQVTVVTPKTLPARGEQLTVTGTLVESAARGPHRELVIEEAD